MLATLPGSKRAAILERLAEELEARAPSILEANAKDVEASKGSISDTLLQRLYLTEAKLKRLAAGARAIAAQEDLLGRVLSRTELADGLLLEKTSVPIGVLLIIFEARPDALPQIASLAIRSGNGLLLKGGREATHSNRALHAAVVAAVEAVAPEVGAGAVGLVEGRAEVSALLDMDDVIDLVIPRGGNALVSYVSRNTRIPVLGHADGVCHVYVDAAADADMARRIVADAKTDYPAACNAAETVLVHASRVQDGLARELVDALKARGVTVWGGPRAVEALGLPPLEHGFHHEYSSLDISLEIVDSVDAAIDHINAHGSGHTEVIVTEDKAAADAFLARADAACVHLNCSSRFSDGFRYGLGAEVGISTSRIHARGPVGIEGLLTTKYILKGHGQVVDKDNGVEYTHKKLDTN